MAYPHNHKLHGLQLLPELLRVLDLRHERRGPLRVPVQQVLDDALLIGTGDGAVRLLRVQREGKAAQDPADFLRGFPLPVGTMLG